MSKKKIFLIVLVVLAIVLALRIIPPTAYNLFYDMSVHPYDGPNWQDVEFFEFGQIQVPGDWTYTASDHNIVFYNADNQPVLYAYDTSATIPGEFPDSSEAESYRLMGEITSYVGTGHFKPGAKFTKFDHPSAEFYYGTYYDKSFMRDEMYGSLSAYCDIVDESTFAKILGSFRK